MKEAYLTGGSPAPDAPAPGPVPDVNLTKIKLERKALYVEYTTGEGDGKAEMTAHHNRPVHADLLARFAELVPHLCLLCDLVQGVRVGEEFIRGYELFAGPLEPDGPPLHERPEFVTYKVTGLTFSNTGVVLVGQKRYRAGKVLNLCTPHEALHPEQETVFEYEHLWELNLALGRLEAEALQYLAGKSGVGTQQELDFEGHPDEPDPAPNKTRPKGKNAAANDLF